jgi:hypothetical protein
MRQGVPKRIGVKINLGVFEVSGEWEPNQVERSAAWELYVELITRISAVPLDVQEGMLSEAVGSLYSIFGSTRDLLRRYGPDIAQPKREGQLNFAQLAIMILNSGIRPVLNKWHPALVDWDAQRGDAAPSAHERAWPRAGELRADLEVTRQALIEYTDALARACGVPNLVGTVEPTVRQGQS